MSKEVIMEEKVNTEFITRGEIVIEILTKLNDLQEDLTKVKFNIDKTLYEETVQIMMEAGLICPKKSKEIIVLSSLRITINGIEYLENYYARRSEESHRRNMRIDALRR